MTRPRPLIPKLAGLFGAAWGLVGVVLLLTSAIYRLTPIALAAFDLPLTTLQWSALAANVVFMGYSEGYRGFQKGFSPRVVARARHLKRHPRALPILLAPAFCMSFFAAPRRRLLASWGLLVGIVILVLLVHRMPQPWRGIVDAGVVLGLAWGLATILYFALQSAIGQSFDHPAEVTEG